MSDRTVRLLPSYDWADAADGLVTILAPVLNVYIRIRWLVRVSTHQLLFPMELL